MPAGSRRCSRYGACSTIPAIHTLGPCWTPFPSWGRRSPCTPFPASLPTSRPCPPVAASIPDAQAPSTAAGPTIRPNTTWETGSPRAAGSLPRGLTVGEPLLEVRDLKKHFPVGGGLFGKARGYVKAVDGISFTINRGETLGLVGESGCGKTTTSKLILAAEQPTGGAIEFEGRRLASFDAKEMMDYRRHVQVVFQDPFSSLSPRMRVGEIIGEPFQAHARVSGREVQARVQRLLELVGLRPDMARLFPHEFSGGQRQRLAIARALSTNARLIVLDEPVSALDVSIRAHIIGLLEEIQARLGVSYLFIAHDLAAVSHLSQQTAVMYLGKLVEVADSLELTAAPLHPYTKALFAASLPSHPDERREEIVLAGEVPTVLDPPRGCHFHPRCPFVMPRCSEQDPELAELSPGHRVAGHLYR